MRKILFLISMVLFTATICVGKTKETVLSKLELSALLNEAEDFIDEMNDGRMDRQSDAIYHAIQGFGSELQTLRNSRDAEYRPSPKVEMKDFYGEGSSRSVKMRLYLPKNSINKKLPTLVYLHGGGWTMGSVNSCAEFCDSLSATGIAVLAVEYSLAPEKVYPQGLLDCVSAIEYAFSHASEWGGDSNDISVGGDSAGGNLALASALYLIDSSSKTKVKSLVLYYPVVKAYREKTASWKRYSRGYGLDGRLMEAFNTAYIGDGDNREYLVSPAEASDDKLSKLPPLLIIGAERDILYDQGKEFTDRISQLGGKVKRIDFPGSVHLFITVKGQPTAFNKAVEITSEFLRQ